MPHGYPDYGVGAPIQTVYTLHDMGELAARLGSIVTFDRRGSIFWLDDFADGVHKWEFAEDVAPGDLIWSPDKARSGAFSAKLVTSPNAWQYAYMTHYFTIPVLNRVGFEFSFIHPLFLGFLRIRIYLYDGTHYHFFGINCAPAFNYVEYWDKTDAWKYVTKDFTFRQHDWVFHTIKLVVDLTTGKYVRLIINDTFFDLSKYEYYHVDSPIAPYAWMEISTAPVGANTLNTYIDDVILTQNEP